jgi:DNA repair ATPase RecN
MATEDTAALAKRLRNLADAALLLIGQNTQTLCNEAADALDAQAKQIAALTQERNKAVEHWQKLAELITDEQELRETAKAEVQRLRAAYDELIMAVARKYPGESRHQTALRYIQRAETPSGESAQVTLAASEAKPFERKKAE